MEAENARLMPMKVEILNKVVKADSDDTVQFALLGSKDHDQHVDVVFTFNAKDVSKGAVADVSMDLWLSTQINSHRVDGFDVLPVETKKVKKAESRGGKGLL